MARRMFSSEQRISTHPATLDVPSVASSAGPWSIGRMFAALQQPRIRFS
jgi:hypothetical protein